MLGIFYGGPVDESTVYSVNTPMIVEASAGSGKTTLLVDKYISILLYLTAFQNRSPFESVREIVALTYTRKAAEEMKDRIRKKARESINPSYLKQSIERLALYSGVDPGASDSLVSKIISQKETLLGALSYASISTIHSFALKILKEHPVEAKLDPSAAPNDDITFKDALFPALRFLIDSRDAGLSCLIKLMGFEKTESMVEELLEAADSYGFKALYDMAGRSGYFDYREVPDEAAWLESRIKPRLRSLLQAMETARPEIRKTGLAGLDNTIVNIRSALRIDNLPDLYHADFYYGAASRVVKDAADPEYKFIASEMNKYAFPFLWGVFESVFNNYSKLKRERKEISFSDIETILLDSISRDAGFAAEIKKNIGYILIDEYQDTSFLQKEIFDSLIYDGKGGLSIIPFIVEIRSNPFMASGTPISGSSKRPGLNSLDCRADSKHRSTVNSILITGRVKGLSGILTIFSPIYLTANIRNTEPRKPAITAKRKGKAYISFPLKGRRLRKY